jgi:DNA-binding IclR family transcriptional regulator
MSGERIQVIERAVDVIDSLSYGPLSLTEVSQQTGFAKGTVFRILHSLGYGGLVVKDPIDNRYLLGPGLWRYGQNSIDEVGMMAALAGPIVAGLREFTAETITLNTRIGLDRVCIVEHQSSLPLLYRTPVGSRIPLHIGASGKTLLAYTPEPQQKKLLGALASASFENGDPPDPDELKASLDQIVEQGWAESTGERLDGAAGVAVAILPERHQPMTVSVLGPESRLTAEERRALAPALQKIASQVDRRISTAD